MVSGAQGSLSNRNHGCYRLVIDGRALSGKGFTNE
jgi:hypothetical protein